MENDHFMSEILQTLNYTKIVLGSLLKRIFKQSKVLKFLFSILFSVLVIDILMIIAIIGNFSPGVVSLINDIGSDIRTTLIYLGFYILLFLATLPFLFIYEASNIHKSQSKIIAERVPDELTLEIEHLPNNAVDKNGKTVNLAALRIVSLEKKKIVELQALIHYDHFEYIPESNTVRQVRIEDNSLLYWIEMEDTVVDLRPEIPTNLLICEIIPAKTENRKSINVAQMGGNLVRMDSSYSKESLFQITILFQGKLEGEYEFKTLHYEDLLYVKPSEKRILLSNHPELTYNDIPQKLMNRGKTKVEFFSVNIKQKMS